MEIATPVAAVEPSACDSVCWRPLLQTLSSGRLGSVCFAQSLSHRIQADAPACALTTGYDRHVGHNSHESRLQRLLDGDEAAGNRPAH